MGTSHKQLQETEKKEKNKKFLLLLLLLLLFSIVILLTILIIKSGDKNGGKPTGGVQLQVDPNAGEYQNPDNDGNTGVAIPGWGTINISKNKKKVNVDFFNPEANKDRYYLTFELRIIDNSKEGYEVLYTSGLVEPGLHIQNIELTRGLPAGTYDAVVHVQPYRIDEDKTPTNNADMKTTLVVK